MKRLSFLFVLILPLFFVACEEDGAELSNVLSYDGEPFSAPLLPPGTHTFAVRFGAEELRDYIGKSIKEVTFFAGGQPEATRVILYGEGTASEPGTTELGSRTVNNLAIQDWTDVSFASSQIEITEEDIWVAVEVVHAESQQSVGCDQGPNQTDGDWLFRADDPGWKSFSATTPESVNWNIRVVVSD
ncbi:MAG: hypothetical protein AAF847_07905 [Bacteroidota bacterium]